MSARSIGRVRAPAASARAFTLIEVLVALVILAIVSVLAYRGTAALTAGEAQLAQESARWRDLDRLFDRLEADLRAALPRPARHGNAREPAWWTRSDGGDGSSMLVLSRAGPDASGEPGRAGQRVGYRVRDGALEVLYWPAPDNVAGPPAAAYVLQAGVARFRVEALTDTGEWSAQWPQGERDGLPRGVRVELTLDDGTRVERWFALR
jgi:general secretion pathway protein J